METSRDTAGDERSGMKTLTSKALVRARADGLRAQKSREAEYILAPAGRHNCFLRDVAVVELDALFSAIVSAGRAEAHARR